MIDRASATPTVCFAEPPAKLQVSGDDYYTILGVVRTVAFSFSDGTSGLGFSNWPGLP